MLLNYLGYSLAERGEKLAEARTMIEAAAKAEPNDGSITDSLGWIELKQGELPDAVRTLERAVELMPSDPTITAHLGDAYAATGRALEATYQWERALTLHPDAKEAESLRGKLEGGARQASATQAAN
jgi:Flp pilus assembly protein TadD